MTSRADETLQRLFVSRRALETVRDVAQWMTDVPGRRKALVLFSEGIDYQLSEPFGMRSVSDVITATQDVLRMAARSNVNVYTIDPRGLVVFDSPIGPDPPLPPLEILTMLFSDSTPSGDVELANLVVTDDGGRTAICPKTALQPGESMICTAGTLAVAGTHEIVGTVYGRPLCGENVSVHDPAYYRGRGLHAPLPSLALAVGQGGGMPRRPLGRVGAHVVVLQVPVGVELGAPGRQDDRRGRVRNVQDQARVRVADHEAGRVAEQRLHLQDRAGRRAGRVRPGRRRGASSSRQRCRTRRHT